MRTYVERATRCRHIIATSSRLSPKDPVALPPQRHAPYVICLPQALLQREMAFATQRYGDSAKALLPRQRKRLKSVKAECQNTTDSSSCRAAALRWRCEEIFTDGLRHLF